MSLDVDDLNTEFRLHPLTAVLKDADSRRRIRRAGVLLPNDSSLILG